MLGGSLLYNQGIREKEKGETSNRREKEKTREKR